MIQRYLLGTHNLTFKLASKTQKMATEKQSQDFHKMVASHILIVSNSGFSRLVWPSVGTPMCTAVYGFCLDLHLC